MTRCFSSNSFFKFLTVSLSFSYNFGSTFLIISDTFEKFEWARRRTIFSNSFTWKIYPLYMYIIIYLNSSKQKKNTCLFKSKFSFFICSFSLISSLIRSLCSKDLFTSLIIDDSLVVNKSFLIK